jgi:hypothetical protein
MCVTASRHRERKRFFDATSWWRVDEKAERQATTAATLYLMIPYFDSRRLRVARRSIFFPPFRVPKSFLSVKCIERKSWKQDRFSLERNSPIGPFDPPTEKRAKAPRRRWLIL